MKICVPTGEYRGQESEVYGHFGSAECFVMVDTETGTVAKVSNRDREHVHGMCSPLKALADAQPDVVLVGGIGQGARVGLSRAGIRVYRAPTGTVADAVKRFQAGDLQEWSDADTCAGHTHGNSCHESQ